MATPSLGIAARTRAPDATPARHVTGAAPRRRVVPPTRSTARAPVDLEIVIPAYNEEHRLPRTIDRTVALLLQRPWSSRIVVVDNGSVDATPVVADRALHSEIPVETIGCATPGKGAAVRRGVLTSTATFVGYMDADLATPVDTVDTAVDRLLAGADVVVASRRVPGAEYAIEPSLVRRAGAMAFRLLAGRLVPEVHDTQCGFKFFRGPAAQQLFADVQTTGFAFDVEVLALAHRARLQIEEIPVSWSAVTGSQFHPVRDGVPSFVAVARVLTRLRGVDRATPRQIGS